MLDVEQRFLNGFICFFNEKKYQAISVFKGGSSEIILNTIQNINDSFFYSIYTNKVNYKIGNKMIGFIINNKYPYLKQKKKLHTDILCQFIEEVGGNIDFVLFGTVHIIPGEFLNFLEIFSFLKKNAIVVFHDIEFIRKGLGSNVGLF